MPFYTNEEIVKLANSVGGLSNDEFSFKFDSFSEIKVGRRRCVNVINTKTKEIKRTLICYLQQGQNPFRIRNRKSNEYYEKEVNLLGFKFKNKHEFFKFHSFSNKKSTKGNGIYINVINPETGIVKEVLFKCLKRGCNPFNLKKPTLDEKIINAIGNNYLKKDEHFKFHSFSSKRCTSGSKYVKIINPKTGIIKEVLAKSLKRGSNPFNKTQNRIEVTKLQPQVFKILKSSKVSDVQKEFKLSKRSRADFVINNNNKIDVIEVKNDVFYQTRRKNLTQKSRYEKDAKKKFGSKFGKVIMVSPKGTNGCYSFKDLPLLLK